MSLSLTKEQRADLLKNFNAADSDGDGQISRQELQALFMKLFGDDNPDIAQMVDAAFTNCDTDKSGLICFDEYIRMMVPPK